MEARRSSAAKKRASPCNGPGTLFAFGVFKKSRSSDSRPPVPEAAVSEGLEKDVEALAEDEPGVQEQQTRQTAQVEEQVRLQPPDPETSDSPAAHSTGDGMISVCPSHCADIADYASRRGELSNEETYGLLVKSWEPPNGYEFPRKEECGKRRSFQKQYLQQHQWLSYSPKTDGAFCKVCVLFGGVSNHFRKNSYKIDRLVSSPYNWWTSAAKRFRDHEASEFHKDAAVRCENFRRVMESDQSGVRAQLEDAVQENIERNRKKLASIVKTVIFCGKQNIPLRGKLLLFVETSNW